MKSALRTTTLHRKLRTNEIATGGHVDRRGRPKLGVCLKNALLNAENISMYVSYPYQSKLWTFTDRLIGRGGGCHHGKLCQLQNIILWILWFIIHVYQDKSPSFKIVSDIVHVLCTLAFYCHIKIYEQ